MRSDAALLVLATLLTLLPMPCAAGTEGVPIEVLVEDRDQMFVTGLTRDDFEVHENGKRVEVSSFELRSLVPAPASEGKQPLAVSDSTQPRRFILFVDLFNSGLQEIRRVQPGLKQMVSEILQPSDQMMIAILAPDRRLLVLQSFTTDRSGLLHAVEALRGSAELDNSLKSQEAELGTILVRGSGSPDDAHQALSRIERTKNMIAGLSASRYERGVYSLKAVAALVERVEQSGEQPGPKILLYVSEGLEMRPGERSTDSLNRYIDRFNRVAEQDAYGQKASAMSVKRTLEPVVQSTVSQFNRCSTTVYAIDAREPGRQGQAGREAQEVLGVLATDTGGVAYFNLSGLERALREIERKHRISYLMTYAQPEHKKNAKPGWCKIEVKCKRAGVKVRHDRGYLTGQE